MLGNHVDLVLRDPDKTIYGELRKQSAEGVWLYHGWGQEAAVRFYPQHRIVEMTDRGYTHR